MLNKTIADRYEISALLRRKGGATTYSAVDKRTGTGVALKMVPRGPEDRWIPHLSREFEIGSRLSHPNLVKYVEFFDLDDCACLVTERIDGDSLLSALPNPVGATVHKDVLFAFHELQNTLDYLHGKEIVHCNLAPSVVLLTSSGNLKLVDLGHCHDLAAAEPFWHPHFHGTVLYSSPEHHTGRLLPESDYYVVGTLFLEYLSGRNRFNGTSDGEILLQIRDGERNRISTRSQAPGKRLESVLGSLLAPSPLDRREGWNMLRSFTCERE